MLGSRACAFAWTKRRRPRAVGSRRSTESVRAGAAPADVCFADPGDCGRDARNQRTGGVSAGRSGRLLPPRSKRVRPRLGATAFVLAPIRAGLLQRRRRDRQRRAAPGLCRGAEGDARRWPRTALRLERQCRRRRRRDRSGACGVSSSVSAPSKRSDRAVCMRSVRGSGEFQDRAKCRRDTCIVGIAVLDANAVDALRFVPDQQRLARRVALPQPRERASRVRPPFTALVRTMPWSFERGGLRQMSLADLDSLASRHSPLSIARSRPRPEGARLSCRAPELGQWADERRANHLRWVRHAFWGRSFENQNANGPARLDAWARSEYRCGLFERCD